MRMDPISEMHDYPEYDKEDDLCCEDTEDVGCYEGWFPIWTEEFIGCILFVRGGVSNGKKGDKL